MKKKTKTWLLIAAALVLIGCVLFAAVMTKLDWDFMKLSTVKYVNNTHLISDAFDRILMKTDTADISFILSNDGRCRVECWEEENAQHLITLKDNTLIVETAPKEHWYDYIGVSFDAPRIKVCLPRTEYASLFIEESTGDIEIPKDFDFNNVDISLNTGDVGFGASASGTIQIKTNTGDICAEGISAGALDLSVSTGTITVSGVTCEGDVTVSVSTGKAYLADLACKSIISSGGTGDISLNNVIAKERFSIVRSTGDVRFNGSDAAEVFVKTDTGDVTGSLLTDKVFIAQTDTGDVDVPETVYGGRCEIITGTGDIKLDVQ